MELEATAAAAANDGDGAATCAPSEQTPATDTTTSKAPNGGGVSLDQQPENAEGAQEKTTEATDQHSALLAVKDAVPVEAEQGDGETAVQSSEKADEVGVAAPEAEEIQHADGTNVGQQEEGQTTADDVEKEETEVPGSDVSTTEEDDAVAGEPATEVDAEKPEPEKEAVVEADSEEKNEEVAATPAITVVDATNDVVNTSDEAETHVENQTSEAHENGTVDQENNSAEVAATVEKTTADKAAPVTNGELSSPTHDEDEYNPSASSIDVSVPHGADEYDPANPSPAGTPLAVNSTRANAISSEAVDREEYDPDHPSMNTSSAATETPAPMEVDDTPQSMTTDEQPAVTPAKRKADEEISTSSATGDRSAANNTTSSTESKRPRYVDSSKSSPRGEDDHKISHHHRSEDSASSPSSSRHKHHDEDHKGLSPAAWDRLMDFQSTSDFRVTQVSRAAFASVGAMPEFSQIAIIARFVRTPLQDVRDKNGQLMRIYREYQKENPQIAALQPVDVFISDYKSDPGLFRFGYAPPQPLTGVSSVRVPYQRDQLPDDHIGTKSSPRSGGAVAKPQPEQPKQKDVDEFGRAMHHDKAMVNDSSVPARAPAPRAATDPRLASRSRPAPSSPSVQPMPRATTGSRTEDPRRRDQPQSQSNNGATRDPRRRGVLPNHPSPRGGQAGAPRVEVVSELYERLPPSVKGILDNMRREGRLHQTLNDNVISRLLHLPERVALQAVENFSNVDLSQVGNLQGFLVGIINRVQEKSITSEKQHRQQAPSPRGQPSPVPQHSGCYAAPSSGGSVLGGPPPDSRLGDMNNANGGSYRGQGAPMTPGPSPALYERPYEAPQDPRRRQPMPQGSPPYGGAVRGPPTGRGPTGGVGMQSFVALPISVQNHVHSLVANGTLASVEELGGKCYEVLGQLSEPLANQVLTRFAGANLSNVRNRSGFLIGVVKRCRQEYGFNN